MHKLGMKYFAAALVLLSVFTVSDSGALEPLKGIKPPGLTTTIPSFEVPSVRMTASGVVQKGGTTSYMYGTHILVSDSGKTLYALKSNSIDLDRFIGKKVSVSGELVKGYPVDGGPDYLDVKSIQ